jgi:TP901 family phage tail tape measure protein
MPIKVPVVQTGLEASIQAAAKKAGKAMKIDMGAGAKSIEGLSQPLGRITGKADQFTKSMEAANARVLAFGASVGVLSAVSQGFKELVKTTIEVEKQLTAINSILKTNTQGLEGFRKTIFDVAKNTEQSFGTVAEAALELSRQGLKAEVVVARLNDSMILSRVSGLGAAEAVAGLTAAINNFKSAGLSSAEILNKLSAAAISAAVSERDLIEGIKRSGSVATQAGVSFNELVGVISAVQEKTARGGAVIGNSFKTIFTRIQSIEKLKTMQNLGVEVTDAAGEVLGATKLIQNLAKALQSVPDARRLQIAENLVGKFQIAPFLAILDDYNQKTSTAIRVTEVAANATDEAYTRNIVLSQTLSAALNKTVLNVKELANTLGTLGVTDNLKNILTFFNSLVVKLGDVLEGEGMGNKFAKGLIKGIGNIISGPGLAIFGAVIAKLTIDLARFGVGSLQTFFGLNKAAKEQATLQGQIASTLIGNKDIQQHILNIERSSLSAEQKKIEQTKFFTIALREQLGIMTTMQGIAARVAPGVMRGTRGRGRGAGGYIPNFNATVGYGSEQSDINRGVGGAPKGARPVTMPNFNFGGGQRGTMVANSSEYVVPNFGGSGGSAIFNQNMVSSMGLPSGARKIGAAGGYIPNFAAVPNLFGRFLSSRNRTPQDLLPASQQGFRTTNTLEKAWASNTAEARMQRTAFQGLSETQLRNLKVQHQQGVVLARKPNKGKNNRERVAKFGVFFPDAFGGLAPTTFALDTTTNMVGVPVATDPPNALYKEVRDALVNAAGAYATRLGFSPDIVQEDKFRRHVDQNLNPGSVEGAYGTVFEAAFQGALGTKQRSNVTWDLPNQGAISSLIAQMQSVGILKQNPKVKYPDFSKIEAAEFKNTLSAGNIASLKGKVKSWKAKRGQVTSAGGYIPNYADPLQDAIGRERSAGLPLNQIRVNQNPKLRNAGNPQGLGVTNLRDEPTGRIPNYAKSDAPAEGAMGGLLMKLIGVQMGFSMLSGVLGEVTEKNKGVAKSLETLNMVIMAAITAQMFGGAKGIMGGAGNLLGTFSGKGAWATKGSSMLSGGMGQLGKARGQLNAIPRPLTGRGAGFGRMATGLVKGRMLAGAGGKALMGGLKVAGGALLRFAGPIGAAATAAMIANKAWQKASGVTDLVAKNQEQLAKTTKDAAKELADLKVPASVKEQVKEGSRRGAANTIQTMRNMRHNRMLLGGQDNIVHGADKQVLADLEAELVNLSDQGVSSTVIQGAMRQAENRKLERTGRAGSKWSAEKDLSPLMDNLMRIGNKFEAQQIINRTTGGLSIEQQAALSRSIETEAAATKAGRKLTRAERREEAAAQEPLRIAAGEEGMNAMVMIAGVLENIKSSTSEISKIDKIRADIAKNQLESDIKVSIIRSKYLTDDQKALNTAKAFNSLSTNELLLLEKRVSLAEEDRKSREGIANIIMSQVKEVAKLDLNQAQQLKLREKLQELDFEELNKKENLNAILEETYDLENKSKGEKEALLELVHSMVDGINAENAATKKGLSLKADENRKLKVKKEIMDSMLKVALLQQGAERRAAQHPLTLEETEIQHQRAMAGLDPLATPKEKAGREADFVRQLNALEVKREEVKNLSDLNDELVKLREFGEGTQLGDFVENFEAEFGARDTFKSLKDYIDVMEFFAQDRLGGFNVETNKDKMGQEMVPGEVEFRQKFLNFLFDLMTKPVETAAARTAKQAEADEAFKLADAYKLLNHLLRDFALGLKQAREQLKFDFLFSRSGGDMVSNINQRMTNQQRQDFVQEGGVGTVKATQGSVIRELEDQMFLARTAAESRGIEDQLPMVREQFAVMQDIARLQETGNLDAEKLAELKQKILDIEKRRLAVGDSLGAQLKNEFVFTQEEIQRQLHSDLVGTARTFVDTISTGLVDAIAKGENLGDTLRDAATNFFSGLAQNNMDAAFKQITSAFGGGGGGGGGGWLSNLLGRNSGGLITGGSGTRDDVPTLLTDGEFVIRRGAVEKYGTQFFEGLNRGRVGQMQRGGLYSPGTYGQGAIKGKGNLLDFATQSFTGGQFDQIGGGEGFGSASLEPQSGALTMFGRRNSPLFQKEQQSKEEAFGLFVRQTQYEEQVKEQEKERKKAFMNSLLAAAGSVAMNQFATGFSESMKGGKGFGSSIGAGFTGFEFEGEKHGGLFNWTGGGGKLPSITRAERTRSMQLVEAGRPIPRALSIGESSGGAGTGLPSWDDRGGNRNIGDFLQSIIDGFTDIFGGPGVLPPRGGLAGIHKWGRGGSNNFVPGFATGGSVDGIPARLSDGEFVMNAAATQRMGRGNLAALNSGGGGDGGDGAIVAAINNLGDELGGSGETTINITVNSDGTETQDGNGAEEAQTLAAKIRDVVKQTIAEEQRLGGSLRRA